MDDLGEWDGRCTLGEALSLAGGCMAWRGVVDYRRQELLQWTATTTDVHMQPVYNALYSTQYAVYTI